MSTAYSKAGLMRASARRQGRELEWGRTSIEQAKSRAVREVSSDQWMKDILKPMSIEQARAAVFGTEVQSPRTRMISGVMMTDAEAEEYYRASGVYRSGQRPKAGT